MKIEIDLDENALRELILNKLASALYLENVTRESNMIRLEIKEGVRNIIYKQKEEIINRVVKQASAEMVRKGIAKLLDSEVLQK